MELRDVIIIGVALAMDALGVTIGIGVNSKVSRRKKVCFILSFAVFQILLFFLGGVSGFFFDKYIISIPNIIGGITIFIVGVIMIKEGFNNESENGLLEKRFMAIVLGISVSIDALVVGFTAFHAIDGYWVMATNSLIVGIITLVICTTGFYLCRYIRKVQFVTKYADFLGGIMLILFAIKMLVS